jgi:hypothetical protein
MKMRIDRAEAPPPNSQKRTAPAGGRGCRGKCEAGKLQEAESHEAAGSVSTLGFDHLDALAIYNGQTLLGFVHKHGNQWVAFGHDEQRIGSFADRKLATRAVIDGRSPAQQGGANV